MQTARRALEWTTLLAASGEFMMSNEAGLHLTQLKEFGSYPCQY